MVPASCPDNRSQDCPERLHGGCPDKVLAGCPDKPLPGCPDKALAGCPDKALADCPDKALAGCPDKVLASCHDQSLASHSRTLKCWDKGPGCQEKNANSVSYREKWIRSTSDYAHSKRTCRGNSDLSENTRSLDRRRVKKSTHVNCSTSGSKLHNMNR